MDKKIAGLLGAVAGLATMSATQAASADTGPAQAPQPASYADLLAPIATPVEALKADDVAREEEVARNIELAQYYYNYPPYPYYRYYHHHHHGMVFETPFGGVVIR